MWARHGLLNREAGRLSPATKIQQTSQWICLLTMQLLPDSSGGCADLIGCHDQIACQEKPGLESVVSLAVAGTWLGLTALRHKPLIRVNTNEIRAHGRSVRHEQHMIIVWRRRAYGRG